MYFTEVETRAIMMSEPHGYRGQDNLQDDIITITIEMVLKTKTKYAIFFRGCVHQSASAGVWHVLSIVFNENTAKTTFKHSFSVA